MSKFTSLAKFMARPLSIIVLATFIFGVLGSTDSVVSARETRTAIFGTAVSAPDEDQLDVITRGGQVTLTITRKTKIGHKKGTIKLEKVTSGTSVTGYFIEKDDELVAGKLTFRERKNQKRYKHVIGVVVKKDKNKLTVQTTEGDEVTVNQSGNPTDDETQEGSLIATVVETGADSANADAVAVRTAAQTIQRLSDAIGSEITLAQEKLLKARMSSTASVHLTRLYETLDQIQADAQSKINAAFAEFQETYTTTLDNNLISPPLILISGKILSKTSVRMVVAANGNGRRSFVTIPANVEVVLLNGNSGTILNVDTGAFVEVSATPQTNTESPIAQTITIIPTPEKPGNSGKGKKKNQTITGAIVLIENGNSGTQRVVVIDNPNGSDEAAAITPDTTITGSDNQLAPGQEVEITLGNDGFSAEKVAVVSSTTPTATPTATQVPPVQYRLIGIIRAISTDTVIIDNVQLTLDTTSLTSDPLTVGQEMQFTVVVDESGRLVIVGVGP